MSLESLLNTIQGEKPRNKGGNPNWYKGMPSANPGGRPHGWRKVLKSIVGEDGEHLWAAMMALAEGKPLIPKLPDGREGPPIIPTAEVALRAQVELAHLLVGKPVTQDQIMAAEQASRDMADIRLLSDAELERRARLVLSKGLAALEARKGEVLETTAVVEPVAAVPPIIRKKNK